MNNDLEFNSKRFLVLLIVVCVVFFIVVVKAFEYLPARENDIKIQKVEDVNQPTEGQTADEESVEPNVKKSEKVRIYSAVVPTYNDAPEMEEIDAPPGAGSDTPQVQSEEAQTVQKPEAAELTNDEKAFIAMGKAQKLKKQGKLTEALAEYQKVPGLTEDKDMVASSYEGIATLYASSKKYGTALSYATKAYNIYPSSSREILLARLYYKTGDIDKATRRVNNILHREFSDDR